MGNNGAPFGVKIGALSNPLEHLNVNGVLVGKAEPESLIQVSGQ